jgi:outer membrane immunogenic protein
MVAKLAFASGIVAAFMAANTARAADMATKAPPPMPAPAVYTWTGYYFGGNVGYGWGKDPVTTTGYELLSTTTPLTPGSANIHQDDWFGGVQAGYNWQTAPNWLVGLEADIQYSGMSDTANCVVACGASNGPAPVTYSTFSATDKLDWFGTLRARAGWVSGPALFYVTGGFAFGELTSSANVVGSNTFIGPFGGSYSSTALTSGWALGGGIETQLWAPAWTAKAEYLFVDLRGSSNTLNEVYVATFPGAVRNFTMGELRENIIRVGLNYHFN